MVEVAHAVGWDLGQYSKKAMPQLMRTTLNRPKRYANTTSEFQVTVPSQVPKTLESTRRPVE